MHVWRESNRKNWDERTALHLAAYPVDAFKVGKTTLRTIETEEVGDVAGKSLLHLQCHFGLDTLSWARRGAIVTGVDFSPVAIAHARQLADEVGQSATFIESDVYDLKTHLDQQFDIVFTSYGVLTWLPDLPRWAALASRFVRPGGFFYLAEFHPMLEIIRNDGTLDESASYFHRADPDEYEEHGSYVGPPTPFQNPTNYQWQHSIGDILSAIARSGLRIEYVHEWPVASDQLRSGMVQDSAGWWRFPGDRLPLTFSLKARR